MRRELLDRRFRGSVLNRSLPVNGDTDDGADDTDGEDSDDEREGGEGVHE